MSRLNYKNYPNVKSYAKALRKYQTPSERLLWDNIKEKRVEGFRFLRQHPVFYSILGNNVKFYIADFYCAKLRLIIELDGPVHGLYFEKDKERDDNLKERGYIIKRYKNEELSDLPAFLSKFSEYIRSLKNNP